MLFLFVPSLAFKTPLFYHFSDQDLIRPLFSFPSFLDQPQMLSPGLASKATFLVCKNQFSSVAQSCPTLCDPMNRSTPGLSVNHHLPEFTQTQVHQVGDAIQPSHPLSSPSSPAFNFPRIRVFSDELVLCIRWPKYWSFSVSISP